MRPVDLMIEHGYLITMDAQRRLIADGTVVVAADRIVDLGPASLMAERYQAATHIDARDKVVLPGLIDTHSHAGCSLTKTLGMHLGTPRWFVMLDHVQFRGTGPEYWYADGLLMALERLKFGVTTGLAMLGGTPRADRPEPCEQFAAGVAKVGIRGDIAVGPARPPWPKKFSWWEHGQKTDYFVTMEDTFRVVGDLARRLHGAANGRIRIWVSASRFLAPSPFDWLHDSEHVQVAYAQGQLMDRTAREYDLRIHTHGFGGSFEFIHQKLGILGPHVCVAHCPGLTDDEVRIFADTGVSVAYCPCTRINYASARRLPVIDLLDAGVTVTIATDAPAPDRTLDLFKDLRVAMILQRYAYVDAAMLPEGKALAMVTIDAARALGREHDLGSLEVGKKADLITIGLQAPHLVPRLTLPLRIAYEASGHDVQDVVVDGRLLMVDRQVLTVDERRVLDLAQEQTELMVERSGIGPFLELPDRFWSHTRL